MSNPNEPDDIISYFREVGAAIWRRYEYHPFFEALEAGTLGVEQFARFQTDDRVHVVNYNRVLALGLAKGSVDNQWCTAAIDVIAGQSTADELSSKETALQELGYPASCPPDRWNCSPAREAYVNHLVRTAYEGDLTDIAATLHPCSMFTVVVGKRFGGRQIAGPEAFQRWTRMYERPARTAMREAHEAVLQKGWIEGSLEARERLTCIYLRSLQHQVRVLDAAWSGDLEWN